MSPPWMPLYVADYLADTRRLSTLEHGAYMLLIMDYWRHGGLPDDDIKLARIAGLTEADWLRFKPTIMRFFEPSIVVGRRAADRACGIGSRSWRDAISQAVRATIAIRDGNACVYCGCRTGPFEIDHVFPFSRGGSSKIDNLAIACRPCNRSKGKKTVEEWLR